MARIDAGSISASRARPGRSLTWWQFLLVAVVYVAIIQVGGLVLGSDIGADAGIETAGNLFKTGVIPIGLSALYAIGVASWLGWWPEIIHEEKRVRSWVKIIPILLLLAAAAGTSWGNLFSQQADLVLVFVVLVLIVGFAEELMFRGIGLVTFRRDGFPEAKVALYTSIIFGAVHLSNALSTGPQAILQALVVSLTGYFLYLTRRWAGVIWLAMPVHSSQDFALLSGKIGIHPSESVGALLVLLSMVVLTIVVWRRRHRIEPVPASA